MSTNIKTHEAIRESYGRALVELGRMRPDVVVLDADVSTSTKSVYFQKDFPDRFFNFGIAEQNMMSAAAGMATLGMTPFVNSFSFLTTYRAADQFKNSIVYPNLNVKVAASLSGLSDSTDGPTHQTIADVAWVRALPNLCVVIPSDAVEVRKMLPVIARYKGPVWIRLCRAETAILHDESYEFELGRGEILSEGSDVALIGCGVVLSRIIQAAEELKRRGYNPTVVNIPTIKPLDENLIKNLAETNRAVVTVEEHNIIGGLGAGVCEILSEHCPVPVKRVGIPDTFAESGPYEALLDKYGIAIEDIVNAAEYTIKKKR